MMDIMSFEWQPVAVAAAMMVLDIITGFAGAAKSKAVESGKMREGLWHKAGFFGLIALAFSYEVAALCINFEASSLNLGVSVPELPAVTASCLFIVATEIVSICENLCVLNPDIANLPVIKSLGSRGPASADEGKEASHG